MRESKEQIDSSSTEDEISVDILKEAVDQQFLSDNLYTTEKAKFVPQSGELRINNAKSLRAKSKQNKFTNFGMTDAFQSFVAKKLDELLERSIKESKYNEATDHFVKQQQRRNEDSGIKLLSTSENFLATTEICTEHERKPRKRKKILEIAEDDEDAISKFQEAAIDSERILSKSDTKAWTSKRPEPDFKYKRLENGTLVEKQ